MLTTQPDHVITTRDTPLVINVLKNDVGSKLSLVATSSPGYGSLAVNDNHTVTYTPPSDFVGLDSFSYTVQDAANDTSSAIVTVQVMDNEPPLALDDEISVVTGEEALIPVLSNDSDPDAGDRIALIASTAPLFGSISLADDAKTFRYIATSGYVGTDSFIYTIRDSLGQTDKGKVTITVTASNSPPVLKSRRFETFENAPIEIDLLSCANDPDGDLVSLRRISRPGHGSISITDGYRGFYTPEINFAGIDSFDYTVSDPRGATTSGVIEILVKERNKQPFAANDNVETPANTPVTMDVLGNDTDPDNDELAIEYITLPEHGSVTINLDNSLTYNPDEGFVGTDSFGYAATDSKGGTAEGQVSVNITALNPIVFANGYAHRRQLIVPHTEVAGETDLANFPLFIREQGDWLKNTADGGKIEHLQGFDIRFELVDGTQLDHELDEYDPATGSLSAWVRIPRLTVANDTEFYIYYGKPGLQTSEEWSVGVWQDYLAVIDCESGADRSGHGREATSRNVELTSLLGSAGQFNGNDSSLETVSSNWLDNLDALSAQVVFKSDVTDVDQSALWIGTSNVESDVRLGIYYDGQPDNAIWATIETADGRSAAKSRPGFHTTDPFWAAMTWSRGDSVKLYGQGALLELSNSPDQLFEATRITRPEDTEPVPLLIGSGNANWQGSIDEVRFCARELTPSWLATEHRNQRRPDSFYGLGGEETIDDEPAPVAVPETYTTSFETAVDLDVLANDAGNALAITAITDPSHGSVVDIGDGQGPLRYTPGTDFSGMDSFSYTATDAAGRDAEAVVHIHVEPDIALPPPPPPENILISPNANVATGPVRFAWKPVDSATEYLLRVRHAGTDDVAYATRRSAIRYGCESGTCSFDVDQLEAGNYDWSIRPFVGESSLDFTPSMTFELDQGVIVSPPPPPPPVAELPTPQNVVNVSTYNQLVNAINAASPGDHIVLANGTYTGSKINVRTSGTASNPIVIRAANIGQSRITFDIEMQESSRRTIWYGIFFDPRRLRMRGDDHIVRRCYFKSEIPVGRNMQSLNVLSAKNLLVEYCDFTVYKRTFVADDDRKKFSGLDARFYDRQSGSDAPTNVKIRYCYFHDYPRQNRGYSKPYLCPAEITPGTNEQNYPLNWTFEYCLFERCDTRWKVWETKSANTTIRFCTFLNNVGYASFRLGRNSTGYGNWMEDSQSWRMHMENMSLYYNRFVNADILVMAGDAPYTNKTTAASPSAANSRVVGNIMSGTGKLIIGHRFAQESHPAVNTVVEGHQGKIEYGRQQGTIVRANITDNFAPVDPVKLSPSEVGPLAGL